MRRRSSHFVLLLALLCGGSLTRGQDTLGPKPKKPRTPDDYKQRTLKELAAAAADEQSRGNKEETMVVHANILPSRVKAVYAGTERPLPRIKQEVLRQWARLYAGFMESYTEPYETEVLFAEGGAEHWLAVRKDDLPRIRRGLKKGQAVDLHLIRLGAARIDDEWEPLLLVEGFRESDRVDFVS